MSKRHTHASSDDHGQFCHARAREAPGIVAVVATLSKGYDLDYIWKQADAARPRTRPATTSGPARAGENNRAAGGDPAGEPSASNPASGSSASRTTCCS